MIHEEFQYYDGFIDIEKSEIPDHIIIHIAFPTEDGEHDFDSVEISIEELRELLDKN